MAFIFKSEFVTCLFLLGFTTSLQATLIDRGDGMIFDTDQGLTWLQDANLAATENFGLSYNTDLGDHPKDSNGSLYMEVIRPDGRMNWGAALHWIDAMNAANYKGYNDWRLPSVIDIGVIGCSWGYSGTDCGYNVDTSTGEMAYMFHNNLGNESRFNPDGSTNDDGCFGSDPWCLKSTGADGVSFINLQTWAYWYGDALTPEGGAWGFINSDGLQTGISRNGELYAWAVRSGDVTSVKEPPTYLMLGLGLACLIFLKRDRLAKL